ncbi:acyltransferase family protein [Pseudogracilibacillus auburnensis]|uniref:Peptidoglycan/LPS O-acetylase OafA/YrhL n=1 Tax=Pseudogracilibacillus auburnensis TaxID=1494959 RepID=A0A2V3VW33_9BACI|nr:acyltransferase family protein [Pseudogracilibacillus auburnensis]PXW85866.1 peptidoglycan/LPS O-acetylase OafA/YrhL [Pseudogracilibacillus auburnensis]
MRELKTPKKVFRKEIEGLRAVAAMLVAIYHIWLGNVSGGVDVFFVVSGFLITTSLLSNYEKHGKVNFFNFIKRLATRLFPVAFFVLFIVTILSIILLPKIQWMQTVKEVFASSLYYQNWQLAFDAVDYLAQNNEASPFQHYWALSIQGQFYLLWPLILFISVLLAKKVFNKSIRVSFFVSLVFVFVLSFTYSIYKTSINQPWAYFDTFTRVWEFSLGGIIAIIIPYIAVRKSLSFILGWTGLIAIILCGIILQVSTVFPGYAALWPTLSALAIIIAGSQGGTFGVHRILASKPFMKLGSISYAFYLWHWPILIFYFVLFENNKVPFWSGIVLILLSLILSYLTTTYIEKPLRNMKYINTNWIKTLIPVSLTIPVLITASIWSITIEKTDTELAFAYYNSDYAGAMALLTGNSEITPLNSDQIAPQPIQARQDLPKNYEDNCHQKPGKSDVIECEYGDLDNPKYEIALVGGSHSAHWLPALDSFAESENIKILNFTKSGCRFSAEGSVDKDCKEWNEKLIDKLKSIKPDLVFTHADVAGEDKVPDGFLVQWDNLNDLDIPVFAIRDNPRFGFDVAVCVEENGVDSSNCIVSREKVLPLNSAWSQLKEKPENVHYVDLSDSFCEDTECKPVVGNVLVYRDNGHITATYARTLGPILQNELMTILEK